MRSGVMLAGAIVSGTIGMGIIVMDIEYSLQSGLKETDSQMGVYVISGKGGRHWTSSDCLGPELSFWVDNHRLISTSLDVTITYPSQQGEVIELEDKWDLEAGEKRVHEFVIPDSAFPMNPYPDSETARENNWSPRLRVTGVAGDMRFETCVRGEY